VIRIIFLPQTETVGKQMLKEGGTPLELPCEFSRPMKMLEIIRAEKVT
jgi:hypothetical protein